MKYDCKICNYLTDNKGNFYKHNRSQKHISKSTTSKQLVGIPTATPPLLHQPPQFPPQVIPNKEEKVNREFICVYCDGIFSRSDSLTRHQRHCSEKDNKHKLLEKQFEKYKQEKDLEIKNKEEAIKLKTEVEILREKLKSTEENYKEKIKSIEEQKEQFKEHIQTLKNENKFQKQIIESAGGMIKKSMNTMSYLLLNYNTAPQLQSLPDYSIITKDTETLIKNLIHYHKNGTFEKYIGDFIIKQYKKEDPKLQSLWSSDIERLNYFVRELINSKENNETINSKEDMDKNYKLNWTIDKKGIKVKKSIIEPLLDYIKTIGDKYLQEKNLTINDLDTYGAKKLVCDMQEIGNMNSGIKNKSVYENINKYIAPHFYLNK